MHRVERLSIREISKRTGLHRKTIRRALTAETPPKYSRPSSVSKRDPFREWICEQLRADPGMPSLRLRELATELGYDGGKTIFDDYVREVRPRFLVKVHRSVRAVSAERLIKESARLRPLADVLPDCHRRRVVRVPQQPFVRIDRTTTRSIPRSRGVASSFASAGA